jgi:4-amino-4-deoxy-L-arabinose transferase-like glycosyltransferase
LPENDAQVIAPPAPPRNALRAAGYLILIGYCACLFGYISISGRPMTLHEARLPQCSREMMLNRQWIFPHSGGRPYLERPPLPHWIMIGFAKMLGQHCDSVWSVRIPPAAMGLLIVLMTGWMAGRWLGNVTGLLAGLCLASMYEFYYYSTLAEDDIFLAMVVVATMACFVWGEFFWDPEIADRRLGLFQNRPLPVWLFFVFLGLTNLCKGPLVGAMVILPTIGIYLLWQKDWQRIRRYLWVWGILVAVVLALSWHVAAQIYFPEYLKNLRFDFHDTTDFDQPWWYYPMVLVGNTLPWSPAALVGLALTARGAWKEKNSVYRFLWCWAIVPIVILSIPHRKHHHYLVPSVAPWAILAAFALPRIAGWILPRPSAVPRLLFGFLIIGTPGAAALAVLMIMHKLPGSWQWGVGLILVWLLCVWLWGIGMVRRSGGWLMASIVIGVGVGYCWGQTNWPDDEIPDTQFTIRANNEVPRDKILVVNAAVGPLNFFRIQFYLRDDAMLVHNLSYLRSNQITAADLYVIGRAHDLDLLKELGDVQTIDQSPHSHRQDAPGEQYTLFHLTFAPGLQRYPPPPVSPMQAQQREAGPYCGPAMPEPE